MVYSIHHCQTTILIIIHYGAVEARDLAFSARGPRFESGVGNFFSVRSIIITLIFAVGGAWIWLSVLHTETLHFSVLQCKAGNGVR